jgi:hypothetical protein
MIPDRLGKETIKKGDVLDTIALDNSVFSWHLVGPPMVNFFSRPLPKAATSYRP